MVFPSVPPYLDPPNWNNQVTQQAQQPRASVGGGSNASQLPTGPTAATSAGAEGSDPPSSSAARPNSMAERARLARAPQPEPALKCPRCDSTNTKFCYYNNYSLSQPRHFCKTCRRYWTRGGALRNVPVGGGCRRNKRLSKSSSASTSSSSKPSSARQLPGGPSSALATPGPPSAIIPPSLSSMSHHLPFLGPMHHPGPSLGLAFSTGLPPLGMQQHMEAVDQFPVASGGGAAVGSMLDQWRVQQQQQQQQQFPFFGGVLDLPQPPPQATYQLDLEGAAGTAGVAEAAFALGQTSASTARQASSSMKMEDNKGQEMSLQRQYMAALSQGEAVWGGSSGGDAGGNSSRTPGGWNIPGFHSSSTGGGDGGGLL